MAEDSKQARLEYYVKKKVRSSELELAFYLRTLIELSPSRPRPVSVANAVRWQDFMKLLIPKSASMVLQKEQYCSSGLSRWL
jgi:hypothetical protein